MTDTCATRLDRVLAEAAGPGGPFDPEALASLDARELFPTEACAVLDEFGLPAYYAPAAYGGRLTDFSELIRLLAVVARHDLTVAVAHGKTFLGAVSTWVGGSRERASPLAGEVIAGAVVAWGLTERGHGSDLLAGEVTATPTDSGWRLDGTKWMINNATRGDLVCVLARTSGAGGPRGFSLLLADKRTAEPSQYAHVPKLRTHGIRGADISGITFRAMPVPSDALVGGAGQGLEIVLKGLQLTRILCAALSVGAAEHGLRLATGFAGGRRVAGRRLVDLPSARRVLGVAAATLRLVEATAMVAARYAHVSPGELSVVSAIVKALVPTLVDRTLTELGDLLGVRGFLTAVHEHGQFQKLERDHRIVAIFDGTTAVNRQALINQFPALARGYRTGRVDGRLDAVTDLSRPLEALGFDRLALASSTGCGLVQSLPSAVEKIVHRGGSGLTPHTVDLVRRFGALTEAVMTDVAEYEPRHPPPAAAFDLAARYELVFAGAACLRLALANRARFDETWLVACLTRVCALLGAPVDPPGGRVLDSLAGPDRVTPRAPLADPPASVPA